MINFEILSKLYKGLIMHIYPLVLSYWPSLGLSLDPAAPELSFEKLFRTQVGLFWTSWLNGRISLTVLFPLCTKYSGVPCHQISLSHCLICYHSLLNCCFISVNTLLLLPCDYSMTLHVGHLPITSQCPPPHPSAFPPSLESSPEGHLP